MKASCVGFNSSGSSWKLRWWPEWWGRPVKSLRRSWAVSILGLSFILHLPFQVPRFPSHSPEASTRCSNISIDLSSESTLWSWIWRLQVLVKFLWMWMPVTQGLWKSESHLWGWDLRGHKLSRSLKVPSWGQLVCSASPRLERPSDIKKKKERI